VAWEEQPIPRTLRGERALTGNHTLRATGITEYSRNGGKLEIAQRLANHESARTTGLYDRRDDQVSLDEVERILIWAGVGRMLSWRGMRTFV